MKTANDVLNWAYAVRENAEYAWADETASNADHATAERIARALRALEVVEGAANNWECEPDCGSCANNAAWTRLLQAALDEK